MRFKVICEECGFEADQPTYSNADLVRDNHQLEMLNWREDEEACGPCKIVEL